MVTGFMMRYPVWLFWKACRATPASLSRPLSPVFWETLELLNLRDRCRPTSETHLLIEEYHFSSPTSMITCYNPYAIRWMRSSFLAKACPSFSGPKKFFVRSGKRRAIENMAEVTDFLASRGWNVIRDMDLSFAQTVKLFPRLRTFAGFLVAICAT